MEDSASDKSCYTTKNKIKRSVKATHEQIEKILAYVDINGDFTRGKIDDDQLLAWNNLILELNDIGPPSHSSKDWRKIWSSHKSSLKRKSLNVGAMPQIVKRLKQSPSQSLDVHYEQKNPQLISEDEDEADCPHKMFSEILHEIRLLRESQNETNALLKELVDVFKPQSLDEEER